MNLWCVIPAQNEERTVAHVIRECLAAGASYVLVVCNGTSDRTLHIAQNYSDKRVKVFLGAPASGDRCTKGNWSRNRVCSGC